MDTLLYGMVCSASNQAMITSPEEEMSCSVIPECSQELLLKPAVPQVNPGFRESSDDTGETRIHKHEVSLTCRGQGEGDSSALQGVGGRECSQELLQPAVSQVNPGFRESSDDTGETRIHEHEVSLPCRVQRI